MYYNFSENATQRSTSVSTSRRKKQGHRAKCWHVSQTCTSKQVKAVLWKSTKNYTHKVFSRILYTFKHC